MKLTKADNKRIKNTLSFFERHVNQSDKILDLGTENTISRIIKDKGYDIENTDEKMDLDINTDILSKYRNRNIVTAFEIIEHLVSPFEVLRRIPSNKLIATIPLRLWFSSAYRNEDDPWDRHFHEFEDWQFDWLLEKAGWKIIEREKWISRTNPFGVRPLLRWVTPRYYAIYAEKGTTS